MLLKARSMKLLINLEAPPQLAMLKKGGNFKLDGVPKYFSVGRQ